MDARAPRKLPFRIQPPANAFLCPLAKSGRMARNSKIQAASGENPTRETQPNSGGRAPVAGPVPMLTPEDFAGAVQWHPESVRRALRAGRIRAVRLGRAWRITAGELARIQAEGLN